MNPGEKFSCQRLEAESGSAEVWLVLSSEGAVVAKIGPDTSAAKWAQQISFALNATKIADAALMDWAASLIDGAHTPGTSVARDLRAAAREMHGGEPFATCKNHRADCVWSGHVPAPEDAEYVPCPVCGESSEIIRE